MWILLVSLAVAETTVSTRLVDGGATYTVTYARGEQVVAHLSGGPLDGRDREQVARRLEAHILRNAEAFRSGGSSWVHVDLDDERSVPDRVEGGIVARLGGGKGRQGSSGSDCGDTSGASVGLGAATAYLEAPSFQRSIAEAPRTDTRQGSSFSTVRRGAPMDDGTKDYESGRPVEPPPPAPNDDAHEATHVVQDKANPAPAPRVSSERDYQGLSPCIGDGLLGAMLNWNRLQDAITNPDPTKDGEIVSEGDDLAPIDPIREDPGFIPDERYLRLTQPHVTDPTPR